MFQPKIPCATVCLISSFRLGCCSRVFRPWGYRERWLYMCQIHFYTPITSGSETVTRLGIPRTMKTWEDLFTRFYKRSCSSFWSKFVALPPVRRSSESEWWSWCYRDYFNYQCGRKGANDIVWALYRKCNFIAESILFSLLRCFFFSQRLQRLLNA